MLSSYHPHVFNETPPAVPTIILWVRLHGTVTRAHLPLHCKGMSGPHWSRKQKQAHSDNGEHSHHLLRH